MLLNTLIDQSIQSALNQDWHEAIELNLEILDQEPLHIPTLNRLAKAYKETGDIEQAIITYNQVLQIDPYNNIAKKNLQLIQNSPESTNGNANNHHHVITTEFIDEPGITKTIPLVRLGDPHLIASLQPGQIVCLTCNSRLVCVTTTQQDHIGALTDDVAFYLRTFLQAGNTYQAIVKSATHNSVMIFLRESTRCDEYKHTPSFTDC